MNYVLIGIFGLIVGSFLNVLILRMDELETIVYGRSHCPKCKKDLAWYDLIPLLSFVFLRGRCRYCKKDISWQYPLVELGTGAAFIGAYNFVMNQQMSDGWRVVFLIILFVIISALIVLFMYDLLKSLVPDEIVWPAIIVTVIFQLAMIYFNPDYHMTLTNFLLGGLIGAGVPALLAVPSGGRWMGYGDIPLGLLLGLLLGYPAAVLGLFFAFASGGLIGGALLLMGKKKLTSAIPFGPFLMTGAVVGLFWGELIIHWYLSLFMVTY